ncbi:type VI secretion system lipoprotein TssJ [Veronia pacifica]|uniref:Type VI secretion system-associated lipoprotein n=1 Tax=Veronia pacifica TaxID=1080227 RepID=A0A1C3EDT1_9GAMM|nr:type VI secretion system lipoprotein TssJ [Veronia pacifica]ODA31370.1 type VI secretion system-associated lipoprotein [Veronia pacifica]
MIKLILSAVLVAVMTGCAMGAGELAAPKLLVNVKAADNINPNVEDSPSPVELRIFQLSKPDAFSRADFLQIFEQEQGTLKAELLQVRRLDSIRPGEQRQENLPLAAGTEYIGVIAGFANYREAKNKVLYKPLVVHGAAINIDLDGINLSVSGEEE